MNTHPTETDDKPRDECGVFGVFGHKDAAALTYRGLYALQHRGQESAGIVTSDGATFCQHRDMGLVVNVFDGDKLDRLKGHHAVGHNRYSTSGSSSLQNAQPFVVQYSRGPLAIAHNGNLVNAFRIRRELENLGQIFYTTADTEVLAQMLARSRFDLLEDRIVDALKEIRGAYSLLVMGKNVLTAMRDP
ncbi:MAG: class II glutamine amidotransferase, partial [Candidatus Poribacteria bacterium]|nr:class II glutamine amidotransferase [Candidatus Poribacteria bacterium]